MAHYFTREEAEALLPAITVVLRKIQASRQSLRLLEDELLTLQAKALGNGHHLQKRIMEVRQSQSEHSRMLREAARELESFGCELKDPDRGLIDFLSLRNGREIYLCWYLGEERIAYWHYLDTGFAGRQPLDE